MTGPHLLIVIYRVPWESITVRENEIEYIQGQINKIRNSVGNRPS